MLGEVAASASSPRPDARTRCRAVIHRSHASTHLSILAALLALIFSHPTHPEVSPALGISKVADSTTVTAGTAIGYTITMSEQGHCRRRCSRCEYRWAEQCAERLPMS
jgi:hypothetical protein